MRPINPQLRKAFRFFHGMSGTIGRRAIVAWQLAHAEQEISRRDWTITWEDDNERENDFVGGWPKKDKDNWHFRFYQDSAGRLCQEPRDHTCEGCVLRDCTGNVLQSLWGIWDADADYRRLVAAELADEELFNLRKQTPILCNCCKKSVDTVGALQSYVDTDGYCQSLCKDCSVGLLDILMDEELTSIWVSNLIEKYRQEYRK